MSLGGAWLGSYVTTDVFDLNCRPRPFSPGRHGLRGASACTSTQICLPRRGRHYPGRSGSMHAVIGIDPHKHVLSAMALDARGGRLGQWCGGTTRQAIRALQAWADQRAPGAVWAIE